MKDLLEKFLGTSIDLAEAAEGEGRDALASLKRTGFYMRCWAAVSIMLLLLSMFAAWSGLGDNVFRALTGTSWLFSNIMLGLIIWNCTFVAGMVSLATMAGDELFGARFPDVKIGTVISWAKQACGVVVWVEFLHLVAMLLPVDAWRNPYFTIATLMAASVVFLMVMSGSLGGAWGKKIMITTAVVTIMIFVGRNIPGVSDYAGSTTTDTVRTLKLWSAEKNLKGLPDDLLGRKMTELADLQKASINECGKFVCTDEGRTKMAELEQDIAALQVSDEPAPGEAEESTGESASAETGFYREHTLPPTP